MPIGVDIMALLTMGTAAHICCTSFLFHGLGREASKYEVRCDAVLTG